MSEQHYLQKRQISATRWLVGCPCGWRASVVGSPKEAWREAHGRDDCTPYHEDPECGHPDKRVADAWDEGYAAHAHHEQTLRDLHAAGSEDGNAWPDEPSNPYRHPQRAQPTRDEHGDRDG